MGAFRGSKAPKTDFIFCLLSVWCLPDRGQQGVVDVLHYNDVGMSLQDMMYLSYPCLLGWVATRPPTNERHEAVRHHHYPPCQSAAPWTCSRSCSCSMGACWIDVSHWKWDITGCLTDSERDAAPPTRHPCKSQDKIVMKWNGGF